MKVLFVGIGSPTPTFIKRRIFELNCQNVDIIIINEKKVNLLNILNVLINPNDLFYFIKTILNVNHTTFKQKFAYSLKNFQYLKIKPDIIHFQWINHVNSYKWLINYFKVPVLASVRGSMVTIYPFQDEIYKKDLLESFEKCDKIHCVSNSLRNICINDFNLNDNKIFVNYNGINTNKFINFNFKKKNKRINIVSVGALIWRKQIHQQLVLINELTNYPIDLYIIGSGILYKELQYEVYKMNLENRVFFVGQKNEDEIIEYFNNSDIYISTSIAEGLANSVMEASACSLPCIVYECEGMNEIVVDNFTGYIIPFGNIGEMKEKILYLVNNRNLIKDFGNNARKHIEKNFQIDENVTKMVQFYKQILNDE